MKDCCLLNYFFSTDDDDLGPTEVSCNGWM